MFLLRRIWDALTLSTDPARRGEQLAARFLRRQGYRILARNLRTRLGEIDILAQAPDRRTIVVVEVKTSLPDSHADNPRPEVRVNLHKQRKLAALASQIARQYRLADRPFRFDVIGVDLKHDGTATIRHHPAAFESHV